MTLDVKQLTAPTNEFTDLVETHTVFCDGTAPPGSCHRLPIDALFASDVTVWTISDGEQLLGMGALKEISATDGEVKSMHTKAKARGKGVARLMLDTIIAEATSRNYQALWLETGVHPDFTAARGLYQANGFEICPPFGDYTLDPHSVFMTKRLETTS